MSKLRTVGKKGTMMNCLAYLCNLAAVVAGIARLGLKIEVSG
jgi:hypothetical protein